MPTKNPSFAIVINIEPGELEWMGVVLITSARAFLRDDFKFYVHCRKPRVANLSPFTRAFLAEAGAEFVEIENDFQPEYPQGNKVIASARERPEDYSVFMDTDTMFVRPCFLADFVRPGAVSVVPTETAKWKPGNTREGWTTVYEAVGLPLPNARTRLSRHPAVHFPYYNAGMIGFESASAFGRTWLETARTLDAHPGVEKKRPWLDQIALPVSIRKAGLLTCERDRVWNLALNYRHTVVGRDVCVAHYHNENWLRRKGLAKDISRLLQTHRVSRNLEHLRIELRPGLIRQILALGSIEARRPAAVKGRRPGTTEEPRQVAMERRPTTATKGNRKKAGKARPGVLPN